MKSPIVLLQSLLNDFERLEPDVKGLDRDLKTIKRRYKDEGLSFLSVTLPVLCDALDRGLATREFLCPRNFKKVPKGKIPRFLSGFFQKIFDSKTGQLKDEADEASILSLRQVLRFFKKMEGGEESDSKLDKIATDSFFLCEKQIDDFRFMDEIVWSLRAVSSCLLNDLSEKRFEEFNFKHGPGGVSEGYKTNQKWFGLVEAIRQENLDVDKWGLRDFESILTPLKEREIIVDEVELSTILMERASRRSAKLITVPKNSVSRRTITVEPLVNQYVQQGLNLALRDSINKCPILSNCLSLTDQSQNQKLALEGSLTGEWSTIDLKSASDLLSVELFRHVFSRHPLFFEAALECRSPKIKHGKDVFDLKKFAGMGNALTFPVQSVAFAVIAIAAILQAQGLDPRNRHYVELASRRIRVFGDDIVVERKYVHQVVDWLTRSGLTVNANKSFLEGNFLESCGVDAFKGVDMTPVYVRYRPDNSSADVNAIAGLVSTSNQLWLRGYYKASTTLREEVERRLRRRLPLVSKNCGALGWHSRIDAMEATKWNPYAQRLEVKTLNVIAQKRRDALSDYPALLKFFHVPLLGRGVGHLKESSVRFKLRTKQRWVPTEVG